MSNLLDPAALPSPFVGLTPYDAGSARYFAGRDEDISRCCDSAQTTKTTLYYGPTGAGKSSVLGAGLIPAILRENRDLPASLPARDRISAITVPVMVRDWVGDPLASLRSAVATAQAEAGVPEPFEFPQAWLPQADEAAAVTPPRLLLILDQFEEFFRIHAAARTSPPQIFNSLALAIVKTGRSDATDPALGLIGALVALVNVPASRVNTVISLREDCLASLDPLKSVLPTLFNSRLRLDHLDVAGVRQVLTEPIAVWNAEHGTDCKIEAPLAEAILADKELVSRLWSSSDPAAWKYETLFLQMVLDRLWNNGNGSELTREAYERFGKAEGVRRAFVSEALDRAVPEHARGWFLTALVLLVSKTQKFSRTVGELSDEINASRELAEKPGAAEVCRVCRTLVDAGLMRELQPLQSEPGPVYSGSGLPRDRRFEVLHDALAGDIHTWRASQRAILDQKRREQEDLLRKQREAADAEQRQHAAEDRRRLEEALSKQYEERTRAYKKSVKRSIWLLAAAVVLLGGWLGIIWNKTKEAREEAKKAVDETVKTREEAKHARDETVKTREETRALLQESAEKVAAAEAREREAVDRATRLDNERNAFQQQLSEFKGKAGELVHKGGLQGDLQHELEAIVQSSDTLGATNERLQVQLSLPQSPPPIAADDDGIPFSAIIKQSPGSPVNSLAFLRGTPPLLAIGSIGKSHQGVFRISKPDGAPIVKLPGDSALVKTSEDGKWVASFPWGGNHWLLFGAASAWRATDVPTPGETVFTGCFSHDGGHLVTGSDVTQQDGSTVFQLALWDTRQPTPVRVWSDTTTYSRRITFITRAETAERFWASGDDGTIGAFDLTATGTLTKAFERNLGRPVKRISMARNGTSLIASTTGSPWLITAADTRPTVAELKHAAKVTASAIDPQARMAATATADGRLNLWNLANTAAGPVAVDAGKASAMAWSDDGERLATSGGSACVCVWDVSASFANDTAMEPYRILDFKTNGPPVTVLAIDPGGNLLAGGNAEGEVMVWNLNWRVGRYEPYGYDGDPNIQPDSGLAIFINWQQVAEARPAVFKPGAESERIPFARLLDPAALHVSYRWDYQRTPKAWLRSHKVTLMNVKTGRKVEAQPVDWGPGLSSGKTLLLSPAVISQLGLDERDPTAAAAILLPDRPAPAP